MQTIEARAILSAKDATGGVFSQIAGKIAGMNRAAQAANRATMMTSGVAARASRAAEMANGAVIGAAGRFLGPAALAAGSVAAYKSFAATDLQIRRIGITADATEQEVATLGNTLRDVAFASGQSFEKATKGLESLVAGGMDLKEALPAIPAIAQTAQAAGAEVEDMATTTLALNQNLGIATDKMQGAFDVLVKGGKAGKFELKDMARYFPSIAPAAVAAGMKGEEGLMRIVAALQTIRNGTGTTEEAASSMQNIFAKMESEETTKKFSKFGIDLRKEMAKARKEGKDLLEVFTDLSDNAIKGDLSKVPQLFSDMEFARGMRALLSYKDLNKKVMGELRQAAGSTAQDFAKVMNTPAIAMARLTESVNRSVTAVGAALEQLPKMFNKSGKGLSDFITEKSKEIEEKGLLGILPEADQKDIQAIKNVYDFLTSEKKQLEFGLRERGDEGFGGKPMDPDTGRRRLRLFDLQRLEQLEENLKHIPSIVDELEANRAKYQEMPLPPGSFPLPARDPRKRPGYVPEPVADPRKQGYGSEMPPVQPLEVKTDVTGTVEGKAEVIVKVEAGSELLRIVDNVKNAVANLAGKIAANGPGSTGKSSPDAAPNSLNTGMPLP
ncbi:phage tail tape measure protein [Bradyrhizobium sp. C-145]|uniref:phage tail tape measure protein n=1 Tax=Bradyrhizobium sp. C-145 TaxID=574727 RepID=UPI00201B5F06|nr:phage tail tape measure protein [Bradyrhizobium sp. C-145]UQR67360.1 phage tail tape measure protein [Bradyrhizobium sp. C-145]